ncbi:hypothetical protein BDQ12DRAFT_671828 [Crucibulum laeve]|uniref:Uncharacterized protein n=1 Tax=Crucibulum laeve TaxID=68775 RepID=A0A5C3LFA2_9AGAR|nr:hypothetical protein BDQ12DRAFT_671828 [Crucibulum laeve]
MRHLLGWRRRWRRHGPTGVKGMGALVMLKVKDGGGVGLLASKVQGVCVGVDVEMGPLVALKLRVEADDGVELLLASVLVWRWGHFGGFGEGFLRFIDMCLRQGLS